LPLTLPGGGNSIFEQLHHAIQKVCPYLDAGKEFGFDIPCHVICELDMEASRRAFPEMKGEILSRQALGSPVRIFKYERPEKKEL
jgi:hypothetical protein